MRWFLILVLTVAAVSAPAQNALPDKFFIECTKSLWGQKLLVLVDKTTSMMSFKTPKLFEMQFEEDADSLYFIKSGKKNYFSKWNSIFSLPMSTENYSGCEVLEPDSRKPLFK
mgnify:FL=1